MLEAVTYTYEVIAPKTLPSAIQAQSIQEYIKAAYSNGNVKQMLVKIASDQVIVQIDAESIPSPILLACIRFFATRNWGTCDIRPTNRLD